VASHRAVLFSLLQAIEANDPAMISDTALWGACLTVKDLVGDVDIVPSCGGGGGGGGGGAGGDGDGTTDLCADVTCEPISQCHAAGQCDSGTGTCSEGAALSEVACDDFDDGTDQDVCVQGTCVGSAPVACDGEWSSCDSTCDSSARTWTTVTAPSPSGTACPVDGYAALCSGEPYDHDSNPQTPDNECDTYHDGPMWDGSGEESCHTQYTNTFQGPAGGGCSGLNEICSASNGEEPCTSASTLEACERLCLDYDTCTSYEFSESGGGLCHLSETCRGDTPDDVDWVYYYRDYAGCTFTAGLAGDEPTCDGALCDDGDDSTTDDVCVQGVCMGTMSTSACEAATTYD
jgi:hypothetical protein